eukprot:PITA_11125
MIENNRFVEWNFSMAITVLLMLLAVNVFAEPGFLSIQCGAKTNHTDESNITWVTDAHYIEVGEALDTGDGDGSYLHTLRFFPMPLNKSCYQLNVAPNVPYLLRLVFAPGNYSGFKQLPGFAFSIETLGLLAFGNVTLQNRYKPYIYETILVSPGTTLHICLIRTSLTDDPFISTIELRPLLDGMYSQVKPGTMLSLIRRTDVGGKSDIRYPQDNFDRIWRPHISIDNSDLQDVSQANCKRTISTNNTRNLPPSEVMKTAWVLNNSNRFSIKPGRSSQGNKSLLMLYFADIISLNMSESRSFYVTVNGKRRSEIITIVPNYSAVELTISINETDGIKFELVKATDTSNPPIINAFEYYSVVDTQRATYSQDIEALAAIKKKFDIKDWISDPCYLVHWEGIGCEDRSSSTRISKINLSGKNLTGSIPDDFGQLTELINMSLDNNHLIGPLPNISNLTMLERMFIENNNFTGVIPIELLRKPSLKLIYSGNRYLCMHKGECTVPSKSKNAKVKIVLGITIPGALIIALTLMGCIALCWKKSRRKHHINEDHWTIMVPNPTMTAAFSQQDMMAATENFSRKIGQGGFGSVFFGKLRDGNDIAVKVLSLFSNEGVQQFLNEVDLLSRIHHKNLVSLLGYCNECRGLMLIYEHMSGGSLSEHLYGRRAGLSNLSWETRLKIAIDAAQGLEYLHVGCLPKIIHRDVKSSNILLDSNLNGKLADFGISRLTIDGEAGHVTTTVKGTAGYLDPDYFNSQMLTEKSDVYSFGVVLLEIICGRPSINSKLPVVERNLVRWATRYLDVVMNENPDKIAEIVDKRLGKNYNIKSMIHVAKLAIRCLQGEPSARPAASEILTAIKEGIRLESDVSLDNIEHGNMEARLVC